MPMITCQYCGKVHNAKRSTAKFCSASCRAQYHQIKDQIKDDAKSAQEMALRLRSKALRYPEYNTQVISQIETLARLFVDLRKELKEQPHNLKLDMIEGN